MNGGLPPGSLIGMDILIRTFAPDDQEAVLGLTSRIATGVAPWLDESKVLGAFAGFARDDISRRDSHDAVVLVAEAETHVVGFATVGVQPHWSGERQAYIGLLAVDERSEGGGVGRALVERAKDWARDRGLRRIMLDTGVANHHARGFYAHLGFEEESVRLSASV